MRVVGQWVGRIRGMARHFRSGVDAMIREAELEELQKKWQAENARIMAEHPMLPDPDTPPPAGEESSLPATEAEPRPQQEIGRASCRERVGPYVEFSVVAGTLKKQKQKKQ